MKTFDQIKEEAKSKIGDRKITDYDFLCLCVILAGEAKISEIDVRKAIGLHSESAEEDTKLRNRYAQKYLKPARILLTVKAKSISIEEAEKIWEKGISSEETIDFKRSINARLPQKEKAPKATKLTTLGQLLSDLI
jgi:hypothetical protein